MTPIDFRKAQIAKATKSSEWTVEEMLEYVLEKIRAGEFKPLKKGAVLLMADRGEKGFLDFILVQYDRIRKNRSSANA